MPSCEGVELQCYSYLPPALLSVIKTCYCSYSSMTSSSARASAIHSCREASDSIACMYSFSTVPTSMR